MQFINVPTSKSQCFSCICTWQVSETTQMWTDAADSVTWLTLIRGNTCCLQCPASLLESNEATLSTWQTPYRRSSTGSCHLVGDDLSIRVRQVEPFRWDGGEKKSGFHRNEERAEAWWGVWPQSLICNCLLRRPLLYGGCHWLFRLHI